MTSEATILLADDEETFAKATKTLLQAEGYDCHTVKDAEELSQALHPGNIYDLLITDLNMPGNHVMELVDRVQDQERLLPVIIVTGYPSLATAVDSVRLNVLEYIVKPVEHPHLLKAVRQGLDVKLKIKAARAVQHSVSQQVQKLEDIAQALFRLQGPPEKSVSDSSADSVTTDQISLNTDYFLLREGIYNAIEVLQRTKGSFRSKELAGLRLRLQDLLKDTRSQLQ